WERLMTDPNRLQFLEWKPPVYDHRKVFRGALLAAKRFNQKQALYKKIPDSNLAGKMILFGMRGTGGAIVEKYLEMYGCPDVALIDHEDQLFETLASIPVKGIFFWYASDSR